MKKTNEIQLQAGYILDGIHDSVMSIGKDKEVKGLLKFLSCFDLSVTGKFNSEPADSITSIIHNLIIRGLPTRASIFIENKFAEAFHKSQFDNSASTKQLGNIKYKSNLSKGEVADVFSALHIIDPRIRINPNNYLFKLESNFERDFIFKYIHDEGLHFLPQLLHSQRMLNTIVSKDIGHKFYSQRVDFSIEFPYSSDEKTESSGNENTKISNEGLIVEIDGAKFHDNVSQRQLDEFRDKSSRDTKWVTKRIKDFESTNFAEWIKNNDILQIMEGNYNKTWDENWLDILQLSLSPFAIARVQKTIIELIRANSLDLSASEWNILAIERDVPCVVLALDDLKQHFLHILRLQGKAQVFPDINIKVLSTKEFAGSKLHYSKTELIDNWQSNQIFDLIIDVSMLQRHGVTKTDIAFAGKHTAVIRSSHYIDSERKIYTSDFVEYMPVVVKTKNEVYEDISQAKQSLIYFLQNIFRKERFREGQLPIISRALQGKSVIGLLPTGSGKSLAYQLAGLLQPGITIVVDPIKSLMQDQYDNLVRNGIDCCNIINSKLTRNEKTIAISQLAEGKVLFSFVSPERLQTEEFRQLLQVMYKEKIYFCYCVIDEVHCVSEWGHDFRPSYLSLGRNVIKYCKTKNKKYIPIIGLTATASFDVLSDVERELSGDGLTYIDADAIIRFENTNRTEIQFQIVRTVTEFDREDIKEKENDEEDDETKLPRPIMGDIKWQVSQAKQNQLINLIGEIPAMLEQFNNQADYILEWTKENFLIDGNSPEIRIEDLDKTIFYDPVSYNGKKIYKNAGIIFCPHRRSVFGVTDKFQFDKYDDDVRDTRGNIIHKWGEYILDSDGNKVKLPEAKRKGIADKLHITGNYSVGVFMGNSDEEERNGNEIEKESFDNQRKFIDNEQNIMVATKAFGMGIDKPNVRFTVHINIPSSIESFVQEAGRAGRDRKMAVSAILFDDRKILHFDNNFYEKIKDEVSENALSELKKLRNKKFFKEDIPTIIYSLSNDEIKNNEKKVIEYLKEIFVDKDNLLYFHGNSFKGREKEQVVLDELLNEIFLDDNAPIDYIAKKLKIKFNNAYISLALDSKLNRLYINEGRTKSYGYVNLTDFTPTFYNRDFDRYTSRKVIDYVITEIKLQCHDCNNTDELVRWLTTKEIGVEDRLYELDKNGQTKTVETAITFDNKYARDYIFQKELTTLFNEMFSTNIYPQTIKEYIGGSFQNFLNKAKKSLKINIETGKNRLDELKKLYYSPRVKADTDKAIFRLSSIGIIDDYTIDYNSKCYKVYAAKKTDEEYIEHLKTFMLKYYSASRVESEIENVYKSPGNTILKKCLSFLTDFVYKEIAAKRLRSIDDMILACEIGMQKNGNEELKDFIHLYFNSKYAKDSHEIDGENYSLTLDTDNAKEYNFDILWKYLKAVTIDTSGAQKDNVKHLRGATLRLLRTEPNNGVLLLLKAYTLFVLGIGTNKNIHEEATASFMNGFKQLRLKYPKITFEELAENVERYKTEIVKNAHDSTEAKKILNKMTDELYVELHQEWLKNFIKKFLLEYDRQ